MPLTYRQNDDDIYVAHYYSYICIHIHIHIGDSLHHDIQGANDALIDSVFIPTYGVHRHQFPALIGKRS